MSTPDQIRGNPLGWLLGSEAGVRYLALRDLHDLPPDDGDLLAARKAAHAQGPIAAILDEMDKQGFWVMPGPGYNPKYRSTVWALILLAQLGARLEEDERIPRACDYLLEHALAEGGKFSYNGAPGGTIDCLQGNLVWALLELGVEPAKLQAAVEWMARTVTGEGIAPASERQASLRYYAYKSGPLFACGANNGMSCAWGGAKVLLALGKWPAERRTPLVQKSIQAGVDFFFSVDPAGAAYPSGNNPKPSSSWWKFGFPVFYVTDLLQVVEALAGLGYGPDPRLAGTVDLIRQKQASDGTWALEYDYRGKTWVEFGSKGKPNPWVTVRALRALKGAGVPIGTG
jgi:hypothetical protein